MTLDPHEEAWRQEIVAALEASPLSQADLARAIGRAQQQVSDWIAGRAKVPRPDVVFAIEDALNCPDRLAQTQGYVRAEPVDVEVAIRRDFALSAEDRQVLVRMYRALVGR